MKYNNIIFLGLCLGLTTYSALSADSVIKISGRVLDYGCTVSSDSLNFTVDLQKNSARQFPTTGSTSPVVPFQITLSECSKGTTEVRVAFNGIEDAENNTLLKLDEGSNTASGLGIEILDGNMRPVKLNDLHAGGFAPIFPDTCYHLTHYWLAAVDIPVASDNPVHYADAIRYNARTPLQGSLLPLTRLVWA